MHSRAVKQTMYHRFLLLTISQTLYSKVRSTDQPHRSIIQPTDHHHPMRVHPIPDRPHQVVRVIRDLSKIPQSLGPMATPSPNTLNLDRYSTIQIQAVTAMDIPTLRRPLLCHVSQMPLVATWNDLRVLPLYTLRRIRIKLQVTRRHHPPMLCTPYLSALRRRPKQ